MLPRQAADTVPTTGPPVPRSTRAVDTGLSREEPGAPVNVRKSASGGRALNSVNVPICITFLGHFVRPHRLLRHEVAQQPRREHPAPGRKGPLGR